ncbi:MAG: hypothetical protein AAF614_25695 [Chloroflexota bacterium]
MNNNYGSFDSQLAHSIQQDYQRDAANYRLTQGRTNFAKAMVTKLLPLTSFVVFVISLSGLI